MPGTEGRERLGKPGGGGAVGGEAGQGGADPAARGGRLWHADHHCHHNHNHDQHLGDQVQHKVELEQERHMADSLVGAMKPELRDRFMQVRFLIGLLRQEVVHQDEQKGCQHLDNWFMCSSSLPTWSTRAPWRR